MFDRHYAVWPDYLPHRLALPQTSLYANLAISAQRYPDRNAILYYDTPITYAELERESLALAGYLTSRGVGRGDRVLLYMQNAPQYVIAFYAILRANAVVVPVNPMNRTGEIEHYARDTEARLCLCGQERLGEATPLLESGWLDEIVVTAYSEYATQDSDLELPTEVAAPFEAPRATGVTAWRDAMDADLAPPALEVGPDDLAVLPYSSGTTGQPKGCMHTHASVMATAVHSVVWSYGTSEGVNLATLPFFHVTGMQNSMNAHDLCRRDPGHHDTLGPTYGGPADRTVSRQSLDQHRDHGGRPAGRPRDRILRSVEPGIHRRWRGGHAGRSG